VGDAEQLGQLAVVWRKSLSFRDAGFLARF